MGSGVVFGCYGVGARGGGVVVWLWGCGGVGADVGAAVVPLGGCAPPAPPVVVPHLRERSNANGAGLGPQLCGAGLAAGVFDESCAVRWLQGALAVISVNFAIAWSYGAMSDSASVHLFVLRCTMVGWSGQMVD